MTQLKNRSWWFAAGPAVLEAARLLSDGAFKLFVYISLTADRSTGRLLTAQKALARALGKSRGSISSYLDELSQQGVCLIRSSPNQHQTGEIEVADEFWPYIKRTTDDGADAERRYVEQVRSLLLQYPLVRSSFGAADLKLAAALFRKGIPLEVVDRALLLGVARKYISCLDPAGQPFERRGDASSQRPAIYSLSYFIPLLEEVTRTEVSEDYWVYLRRRFKQLQHRFDQPRRDGHNSSSTDSGRGFNAGRGRGQQSNSLGD